MKPISGSLNKFIPTNQLRPSSKFLLYIMIKVKQTPTSQNSYSCQVSLGLTPGEVEEYLLQCCLSDGVILDDRELRLGRLHGGEETGPGRGGVADVEVDVVKVLVRHQAGVKPCDHTALQGVQSFLSLGFFG